jgi:L-malate glycosyltransferase
MQQEQQSEERSAQASGAARPVRVLMVAPSLGILGGQAVQAARLLAELRRESGLVVDFLPINPRLPGVLGHMQAIKYVRTILTEFAYCVSLLRRVSAYDVLHIFSASYFSFVLAPTPAILIGKLFGKKVLLNYRSGQAAGHLMRWRHTAMPTFRLTDAVVAPSGYLVDVFARFGISARSIFNFVATERFRFRARRPLRPVFLSNRNHEPLYNVACTLRAFALIQAQHADARLIVVGDGSQRNALARLARELQLHNVEFVGRVEQTRMHEWYDAADVYLNSPDIDNMPGSIIEAYAAGLPVVTTNAGGIPYIVRDGETGLMVACADHAALAQAALRLLADQALATRLVTNAHAECRKYSWAAVREEWLTLYRELAQTPAQQVARATQTSEAGQPARALTFKD